MRSVSSKAIFLATMVTKLAAIVLFPSLILLIGSGYYSKFTAVVPRDWVTVHSREALTKPSQSLLLPWSPSITTPMGRAVFRV